MPELPEVEYGRKLAEEVCAGRTIARVRCADDRIVYDGLAPSTFARKLKGRTVVAVHRHGKQLWFELDTPPHPLFHFGMTGAFRAPADTPLRLASHGKRAADRSWPPRFTKVHLFLDDGGELAMTNARRLGRIRLRERPRQEPPLSELGFDPLHQLPAEREFTELLSRRRAVLKSLLLDQGFAAGVGNWIADELCYQAGVDPRRHAHTLDAGEAKRLRRAMRDVVRQAVAVDADKSRLPAQWLFHRRWGKQNGATDHAGDPVHFATVGGRTTAWVPARQS